MKFRIHDGATEDSIDLEAKTIDDLRKKAKYEADKRGWKEPWSETID